MMMRMRALYQWDAVQPTAALRPAAGSKQFAGWRRQAVWQRMHHRPNRERAEQTILEVVNLPGSKRGYVLATCCTGQSIVEVVLSHVALLA